MPTTTLPPVTLPPVTLPPVTLPPVTLPPVTLPPVTLPPITAAPTTAAPTTPAATTMTGNWLLTSSAAGDVASTPVLGLAQRDPLNPAVVNLDTDRNGDLGRTIVQGGWTYFGSSTRVQRFSYDPGTAFTVDGRIFLDLYAAPAEGDDEDVKIVAVLAKCDDLGIVCLPVEDDSEKFEGEAGSFELVTLDFGNTSIQVGQHERLEVWVFASDSSDEDLVIAYDSVGSASALRIT